MINLSKLNRIEIYDKDTGEILENGKEIYDSIKREEELKRIKLIYYKLDNCENNLSLEELSILMKLQKRSTIIKLNFKEDGYFIIKKDIEKTLKLHEYTRSMLYLISHMITHDGRLKYENNKIIPSTSDLKKYLKISNDKWNKYIKPDIEKYKILKKENIDNKWCILLNPIYATTTRIVTETMFIAFHTELKEYLEHIDYLYLKKLHKIEV